MSVVLANPRKVPIFLSYSARDTESVQNLLWRLQKRLVGRLRGQGDLQSFRDENTLASWQIRASLWILDARSGDSSRPLLAIPDGFHAHPAPPPAAGDSLEEWQQQRAERIGRLRVRVEIGVLGRAFQAGETLFADFTGKDRSDFWKYGLEQSNGKEFLDGLCWTMALPLVAVLPYTTDDDEGFEVQVLGVLGVDGLDCHLPLEWSRQDLAREILRDSLDLAWHLAALPCQEVAVEPAESDRPRGLEELDVDMVEEAVRRKMDSFLQRLARYPARRDEGALAEYYELARQIADLMHATGERGRKALINELKEHPWWFPSGSASVLYALLLAAEEVEFTEEREREIVRRYLMELLEYRVRSSDSRINSSDEDTVVAALMRKVTSLTTRQSVADTVAGLGRCFGVTREDEVALQQAAAQSLQNLCWASPLSRPQNSGAEPAYEPERDRLVAATQKVLGGGGMRMAPVERATLAMNFVHALALMEDNRFVELGGRLFEQSPYIARLLIPRLKEAAERWSRDPEADRASRRLEEGVRRLEEGVKVLDGIGGDRHK